MPLSEDWKTALNAANTRYRQIISDPQAFLDFNGKKLVDYLKNCEKQGGQTGDNKAKVIRTVFNYKTQIAEIGDPKTQQILLAQLGLIETAYGQIQ